MISALKNYERKYFKFFFFYKISSIQKYFDNGVNKFKNIHELVRYICLFRFSLSRTNMSFEFTSISYIHIHKLFGNINAFRKTSMI